MKLRTVLNAFCVLPTLLCLVGCEEESAGTWDRTPDRMELIVQYGEKWNEYNIAGNFDSVVITTVPLFEQAVRTDDTLVASWSGIFIAQAYMSMQELDSVAVYLDRLAPLMKDCSNCNIMIAYYSTLGNYALRSRLDYQQTIKMYLETLRWAEKGGSIINQIAVLYDVVYLFYILDDGSGMEYAEKAYSLAHSLDNDSPQYCLALTMMGMMNIQVGSMNEASVFLDSAKTVALDKGYNSQIPDIDMFRGDIFWRDGKYHSAIRSYEMVMERGEQVYPSTIIRSCLMLGECCYKADMYRKALDYLEKGLSISYSTGVMEFRRDLLNALYLYHYKVGEIEDAFEFYEAYVAFEDSIKNLANEQEFYALLRQNKELEHENEMNIAVMALQKSRQRTALLLLVVIVASVLSVVFYVQRKRQKRMYMQLFDKHQKYLEYFNSRVMEQEAVKSSGNEADKELFVRIESLMRDDKIFRQKGLTLDSLAEKLDTNRTYVSRAINAFSGKTFVNYLNTYRINEAVKLISEPGSQINAKQLAEDLGYASVNVFYQVFQRETGLSISRYKKELGSLDAKKRTLEESE